MSAHKIATDRDMALASAALGTSSEVNVTMKSNGYRREAEKESSGNLAWQYTVTAQRKSSMNLLSRCFSPPVLRVPSYFRRYHPPWQTNCLTSLPLRVFRGLHISGLLTSLPLICGAWQRIGVCEAYTYTVFPWHSTTWHASSAMIEQRRETAGCAYGASCGESTARQRSSKHG